MREAASHPVRTRMGERLWGRPACDCTVAHDPCPASLACRLECGVVLIDMRVGEPNQTVRKWLALAAGGFAFAV